MLKKNYQLSQTKKVQYIQKGALNSGSSFWKKFLASQGLISILALIVLGLILWPLLKNYSQQQALNEEIEEVQTEIAKYEDKNTDLKVMIGYLESDQAIEEKARVNLGLKKEGEKVIVISDPQKIQTEAGASDIPELSNPQKWWRHFFN